MRKGDKFEIKKTNSNSSIFNLMWKWIHEEENVTKIQAAEIKFHTLGKHEST
jgi:hypothetical protein